MNYQYHREDLNKYNKLDYVKEALKMLDGVEFAMKDYVDGVIDTNEYIQKITPYDKFIWNLYTSKPQNTNLFNSKQKKKNSSWREQKWSPIFEKVRKHLSTKWTDVDLILIQNDSVIETVYSSGYISHKKVDGGIGIKTKEGIIPVVVVEDKAGNICSTTFGGINAQAWRLHQSFPNAKYVFITDNQFNVSKKHGTEAGSNVNIVVLERNNDSPDYPTLNPDRFHKVHDALIQSLEKHIPEDFLQYEIIHSKSSGRLTDALIDGIIWNI